VEKKSRNANSGKTVWSDSLGTKDYQTAAALAPKKKAEPELPIAKSPEDYKLVADHEKAKVKMLF